MLKNISASLPISLLLGVVISIILNWPLGEIISHPYRILSAAIIAIVITAVMTISVGIVKTLYRWWVSPNLQLNFLVGLVRNRPWLSQQESPNCARLSFESAGRNGAILGVPNIAHISAGLLLSLLAVYVTNHNSIGVLIIPTLLAAGCISAYFAEKRAYGASSAKKVFFPLFPFATATVIGGFTWKILLG